MSAALPPLPTPKGKVYFEAEPYQPAWVSSSDAFDDDQMQAYATAARADLEAETLEQARIIGMGAERELALMGRLERLEAENKLLREALIEAEARLTLLIEREQHKLLDVVARDNARAALKEQP